MEKKKYSKPVAEILRLNTSEDVLDFLGIFDQSVPEGLAKPQVEVTVEEDEDELESDSVKYSPSYKRYKPFEDWKGTVLDW